VEDALRAIAHPKRRAMLRLVWDRERTASDIAAGVGLSRPAASQHLRVLREAELVVVRPDRNQRLYRVRLERMEELRTFLDGFWGDRLDALRQAGEDVESERAGGR
jgi:DNA-binding transcriptional ArsR family regulator